MNYITYKRKNIYKITNIWMGIPIKKDIYKRYIYKKSYIYKKIYI